MLSLISVLLLLFLLLKSLLFTSVVSETFASSLLERSKSPSSGHSILETKPQIYKSLKTESVYKMYYVRSGKGMLHTNSKEIHLKKGDIFFTFPAFQFCIESCEKFSYMYISFLGTRCNQIMEKLRISKNNFWFAGYEEIGNFWNSCLATPPKMSDLISESVLLYTFGCIGNKIIESDKKSKSTSDTALYIKKYIDDHFLNTEFSIKNLLTIWLAIRDAIKCN